MSPYLPYFIETFKKRFILAGEGKILLFIQGEVHPLYGVRLPMKSPEDISEQRKIRSGVKGKFPPDINPDILMGLLLLVMVMAVIVSHLSLP